MPAWPGHAHATVTIKPNHAVKSAPSMHGLRQQKNALQTSNSGFICRTNVLVGLCLLLSVLCLMSWSRCSSPSSSSSIASSSRRHGPPWYGHQAQQQYVPEELQTLLVVITFNWNVQKLAFLEVMFYSTLEYQSPSVDVVLVTDNGPTLQAAVDEMSYPLNITVHQAEDPQDGDTWWLTWTHRDYIAAAVKRKNYTTVLYMEDDTRMPWRTLVSWAIDTRSVLPFNFTRCFYRTEVEPATGTVRLMDYRHGYNLSEDPSKLARLDLGVDAPAAVKQLSAQLQGKVCGYYHNGTTVPCKPHRYFVAPSNPFQGMWVATRAQLERYMTTPLWNKYTALQLNTAAYLPPPDNNWGIPERSASIGILGGLVPVPEGRAAAPSSCMVPYVLSDDGSSNKPRLSELAAVSHLRNAYAGDADNVLVSEAFV